MQLCFSTLGCPDWTLGQILDAAVANGIEGIDFRGLGPEIDITKLPAFGTELDATLGQLRDRGLSMPCLNTSVTLVSPSPERWQAMLDECHRYATLAQRTGTPYLRVFGGGVPGGMTRDEALVMARRHLRQIVKICRPLGMRPLVETHDDWVTSEQLLELLHELSPDEVGVLWDIEHTYWKNEPPQDVLARMGRFVRHVHVKDAVRIDHKSEPRLLGEGEVPIAESVKALRDSRYDGWICFEGEKRWHADAAEPEQSIPQFARFMRELLASIEASPTEVRR